MQPGLQDARAEQMLVALAVNHPDSLRGDLADADPRWFADPHLRRCFEIARELQKRGQEAGLTPTVHALQSQLGDRARPYLHALHEAEALANSGIYCGTSTARMYLTRIKTCAIRRSVIAHCEEAIGQARSVGNVDDLSEQVTAIMMRCLSLSSATDEPEHIADVAREVLDDAERAQLAAVEGNQREQHVLTTGYPVLDTALGGGFRRGNLITLAARPGMGKTALLLELALLAAQDSAADLADNGERVFLGSIEMPSKDLVIRALARYSHSQHQRIATGNLSQDGWTRLVDAQAAFEDLGILLWHRPRGSIESCIAALYRAASEGPIRLAAVDYVQILHLADPGRRRDLALGDAIYAWKAACDHVGAVCVLLSQLSRSGTRAADGLPSLSALKETGALEEASDVVIGLDRPGVRDRTSGYGPHHLNLHVLKSRHSGPSVVAAAFHGERMEIDVHGRHDHDEPPDDRPAPPPEGGW